MDNHLQIMNQRSHAVQQHTDLIFALRLRHLTGQVALSRQQQHPIRAGIQRLGDPSGNISRQQEAQEQSGQRNNGAKHHCFGGHSRALCCQLVTFRHLFIHQVVHVVINHHVQRVDIPNQLLFGVSHQSRVI